MNIVLAHGILGFGERLGVPYFNGIKQHLEQKQLRVLVTEVDPTASIEVRGNQLGQKIVDALEGGMLDRMQKTHIIAHSMGGLDARFMLSPNNHNNIASRITSLTTIGTPHHGSPVADLLFKAVDGNDPLPFGLPFGKVEDRLRKALGKIGISVEGLRDVTTKSMPEFNAKHPNNNQVRYFSVAGRGRGSFLPTCGALLLTHSLVEDSEEDNDGLVSVTSATRGDTIIWPADHADEVGHDIDRGPHGEPSYFNYRLEYEKLIERVAAL
jgi:triacylglycerol lipase